MNDLVQFLRARLDEDEAVAHRACEYAEAEWRLDEDGETVLWWPPEPRVAEKEREKGLRVVSDQWRGQTIGSGGQRIAPHIARHDPARVLREIASDRALLAEYAAVAHMDTDDAEPEFAYGRAVGLGIAVRHRALKYANHPDYKRGWRP